MSSHPTSSGSTKQAPQFQFRGTHTYPAIFYALRDKKINSTDFLILNLIDAFTYPGSVGCFASNAYLGMNAGGIGPLPVSRSIRKLLKLKFLKVEGKGRLRRLWAVRNPPESVEEKKSDKVEPIPAGYRNPIPAGYTELREEEKRTKKLPAGAGSGVCDQKKPCAEADSTGYSPPKEPPPMPTSPAGSDEPDELLPRRMIRPVSIPKKSTHRQVKDALPPQFAERAIKLRSAVEATDNYAGRWSRSEWAKTLHLLATKDLAGDEARLERVLTWFCKNIHWQWTPHARSAEAFRQKFLKIEAAMQRMVGEHTTKVTVSPEAKKITQRLLNCYIWPERIESELPTLVQMALDWYCKLEAKLTAMLPGLEAGGRRTWGLWHAARAIHNDSEVLPGDVFFVRRWFERAWDWLQGLEDDFTGKTTSLLPSVDHPCFVRECKECLNRRLGDPEVWGVLARELRKEMQS